jgi:hypothetical protein
MGLPSPAGICGHLFPRQQGLICCTVGNISMLAENELQLGIFWEGAFFARKQIPHCHLDASNQCTEA